MEEGGVNRLSELNLNVIFQRAIDEWCTGSGRWVNTVQSEQVSDRQAFRHDA
jgi:hypothetical protein